MKSASYGATEPFIQQNDVLLTASERDLLQSDRPGYGSRSKIESAFNLVNSTVGAGIIGLPFAIYLAGFWTAIILSLFVAIISQLGLYMLVVSGQRSGAYKYAALMEYVMGKTGFYFLNFLILVQASGACVSYFIRKRYLFFLLDKRGLLCITSSPNHFSFLVIGDTIPVLLQLYFPQYSSFTERSLVITLIAIFLVCSFFLIYA